MSGVARIIRVLADIAALILIVWILLALLGANSGNDVVGWFHHAADWLATWSRGMFNVGNAKGQIVLDFGLAAVVYAAVGNIIGSKVR
jgi:hypothetical protein